MAGGRRKYTEEDKDKALGFLMASAVLEDGEWIPAFRSVAGTSGISKTTLIRWWSGRDRSRDGTLRSGVTRAREALIEEGAREHIEEHIKKGIQRCVQYVADPIHYDSSTYSDESGREHVRGARLDHAARALETLLKTAAHIEELFSEDDTAKTSPAQRAAAAMRRTKLGQTLERNQQRNRELGGEAAK